MTLFNGGRAPRPATGARASKTHFSGSNSAPIARPAAPRSASARSHSTPFGLRALSAFGAAVGLAASAPAQTLTFTSIAPGYAPGSIALPAGFGGALGTLASESDTLYVSIGSYGNMKLARVDLATGLAAVVADGPFGSLAGIAPLTSTAVALIDNSSASGGPPDQTILLARDNNPADGDFNDPGEITELIAPILTGAFGFTGAQARRVPPSASAALPLGSLVVQTADGGAAGELLAIVDPLSASPGFTPAGGSWFSGFDYNGGFDFDSRGVVWMGSVDSASFAGTVTALVNLNFDSRIDPGEFHDVVAGENGMADLSIDAEDDVFFSAPNASFAASARTFRAPASPLGAAATPVDFAATNASYLSALLVTSKNRPFEPFGGAGGAVLVLGGFAPDFSSAVNLLTLTPGIGNNGAHDWELYSDDAPGTHGDGIARADLGEIK